MELGLSLGSETLNQPFELLKESNNDRRKQQKFDFAMALSLNSNSSEGAHQELMMKAHKSFHKDDDDDEEEDDDEGYDGDEHTSGDDANSDDAPLQLNLLPVPRKTVSSSQLPSLPLWYSSDNGSSENGSSGNVGPPAMMVLNVNRRPAPVEEVSSSANSLGSSPFRMDLAGAYTRNGRGGNIISNNSKRGFEAMANDVVDDDDNELLNNGTRKKLRLSKEQSAFLEERFKDHITLNPKQKLALAKQLNLRPRQVEVWFQNRRARTKLKQTEVDCEYLKRCCDKLSEENRKLQKELQELRALKTSNTLNMHMPATTLTMCPSCERVATTTTSNNATSGKSGHNRLSNKPRFFPFSHQNQPKAS